MTKTSSITTPLVGPKHICNIARIQRLECACAHLRKNVVGIGRQCDDLPHPLTSLDGRSYFDAVYDCFWSGNDTQSSL